MRVVGADRPDLAVLQHAQQLHLQARGHLRDLVEEERPPVGHLEEPPRFSRASVKAPAHVAEQLALDQGLGDRGGVDGNERLAGPSCSAGG